MSANIYGSFQFPKHTRTIVQIDAVLDSPCVNIAGDRSFVLEKRRSIEEERNDVLFIVRKRESEKTGPKTEYNLTNLVVIGERFF